MTNLTNHTKYNPNNNNNNNSNNINNNKRMNNLMISSEDAVQTFRSMIRKMSGEEWQSKVTAFDALLKTIPQYRNNNDSSRTNNNITHNNHEDGRTRPTLAERRMQSKAIGSSSSYNNTVSSNISHQNMKSWYENPSEINKLGPPLQSLLRDLRSQLVKDVCYRLTLLAPILSQHMRVLLQTSLVHDIIYLNSQSVKLMQTCATEAMLVIIQHVRSKKVLEVLYKSGVTHKNKDVRYACVRYVRQMLRYWPVAYILGNNHNSSSDTMKMNTVELMEFHQYLEKVLQDSSPNVRHEARRLFLCYHAKDNYRHYAEYFLSEIPNQRTKKYIVEALNSNNADDSSSIVSTSSCNSSHVSVTSFSSPSRRTTIRNRPSYIPSPSVVSTPPTNTNQTEGVVYAPFSFLSPASWQNQKSSSLISHADNDLDDRDENSKNIDQSKELELLQLTRKAVEDMVLESPKSTGNEHLPFPKSKNLEKDTLADLRLVLSPLSTKSVNQHYNDNSSVSKNNMINSRRTSSLAFHRKLSVRTSSTTDFNSESQSVSNQCNTALYNEIGKTLLSSHKQFLSNLSLMIDKDRNFMQTFEHSFMSWEKEIDFDDGHALSSLMEYFEHIQKCIEHYEVLSTQMNEKLMAISEDA